jgi:hypothetical protein
MRRGCRKRPPRGALVAGSVAVRRRLAAPDGGILPDDGVTPTTSSRIAEGPRTSVTDDRPEYRSRPLVGRSSSSSDLEPAPGFRAWAARAATSTLGLAWAIIVFCIYQYAGIRKKGWHYIYHFKGP